MGSVKDRTDALRAIPLFAMLDEPVVEEIAGLLIDRKFPKNAVIFEDGPNMEKALKGLLESGEIVYALIRNGCGTSTAGSVAGTIVGACVSRTEP